jgi:hypothetical protein
MTADQEFKKKGLLFGGSQRRVCLDFIRERNQDTRAFFDPRPSA